MFVNCGYLLERDASSEISTRVGNEDRLFWYTDIEDESREMQKLAKKAHVNLTVYTMETFMQEKLAEIENLIFLLENEIALFTSSGDDIYALMQVLNKSANALLEQIINKPQLYRGYYNIACLLEGNGGISIDAKHIPHLDRLIQQLIGLEEQITHLFGLARNLIVDQAQLLQLKTVLQPIIKMLFYFYTIVAALVMHVCVLCKYDNKYKVIRLDNVFTNLVTVRYDVKGQQLQVLDYEKFLKFHLLDDKLVNYVKKTSKSVYNINMFGFFMFIN